MSAQVEKQCISCGKVFLRYPSEMTHNRGKFCSKSCEGKALKTGQVFNCPQCGKPVYVRISQIKAGRRKFCSAECFNLSRKKRVQRICLFCNKSFDIQPSHVADNRGVFCSMDCYRSARFSDLERIVAEQLSSQDVKFIRQFKIGRYYVDFFIPSHNIVIEAEGDFWHSSRKQKAKDRRRDDSFQSHGYRVIHIKEHDIRTNNIAVRLSLF